MRRGSMARKIRHYLRTWSQRGYPDDIPDEVPPELMHRNLAPSYRAIAVAILRNDVSCHSLGFTPKPSPWYGVLKRLELMDRTRPSDVLWRVVRFAALQAQRRGLRTITVTERFEVVTETGVKLGCPKGLFRPPAVQIDLFPQPWTR